MEDRQKKRFNILIRFFILLYLGAWKCGYEQKDGLFVILPKNTFWTRTISSFVNKNMSEVVSKTVFCNGNIELKLDFEDLI